MTWARPSSGNPGSSGGGITSVNGQTGPAVVLTASDVGAVPTEPLWASGTFTVTPDPASLANDPGMTLVGDTFSSGTPGAGGFWVTSSAELIESAVELTITTPPAVGTVVVMALQNPSGSPEPAYSGVSLLSNGGGFLLCVCRTRWSGFWGSVADSLGVFWVTCPEALRWDPGTGVVLARAGGIWSYATTLAGVPPFLGVSGGPVAWAIGCVTDSGGSSTVGCTLGPVPVSSGYAGHVVVDGSGQAVRVPVFPNVTYTSSTFVTLDSAGVAEAQLLGPVGQASARATTLFEGQTAIGLRNLTSDGEMEYYLFGGRYILPAGTARGQVLRMTPWPLGILQSWQNEGYTHDMWRGGAAAARWYPVPFSAGGATAMSTASIPTNTMRVFPLAVSQYHNIEGVAVNVTTAAIAGSEMRLGLYADDNNGYPAGLIADFGAVATSSLGVKSITGFNPVVISPGTRYWFVLWGVGAPTCRAQALGNLTPILGTDMSTTFGVGWSVASAYTAGVSTLPGTFPVGATILTVSSPTPFIQIGT